jgi:hypothetical protein
MYKRIEGKINAWVVERVAKSAAKRKPLIGRVRRHPTQLAIASREEMRQA